jgi:hypothetical protein
LPHVPGFQKQSVFNLGGCRFDAAAALGWIGVWRC